MRKLFLSFGTGIAVVVLIHALLGLPGGWFGAPNGKMPAPAILARTFPSGAQQVLEAATQIDYMSLDPEVIEQRGPGTFHGYRIVGKTKLSGTQKEELIRALYHGMAGDGFVAACFSPRHGIRATHGNKTVDLVICFHCMIVQAHFGGQQGYGPIDNDTQQYFDSVLRRQGVPLSRR